VGKLGKTAGNWRHTEKFVGVSRGIEMSAGGLRFASSTRNENFVRAHQWRREKCEEKCKKKERKIGRKTAFPSSGTRWCRVLWLLDMKVATTGN